MLYTYSTSFTAMLATDRKEGGNRISSASLKVSFDFDAELDEDHRECREWREVRRTIQSYMEGFVHGSLLYYSMEDEQIPDLFDRRYQLSRSPTLRVLANEFINVALNAAIAVPYLEVVSVTVEDLEHGEACCYEIEDQR